MPKIRRTFTLDEDVSEKIDEQHAAFERTMSVSSLVNWVLAKAFGLCGDTESRPDPEKDDES